MLTRRAQRIAVAGVIAFSAAFGAFSFGGMLATGIADAGNLSRASRDAIAIVGADLHAMPSAVLTGARPTAPQPSTGPLPFLGLLAASLAALTFQRGRPAPRVEPSPARTSRRAQAWQGRAPPAHPTSR